VVRRTRFALCLLCTYLVQVALVPRFSLGALRMDLLVLLAAFMALEADFTSALVGVFAAGLLRDLGGGGRLGASALLFLLTVPPLLVLREYLLRENPLTDWALTAVWLLALAVLTAVGKSLFTPGPQLAVLLRATGGQALMTALVAPLVFVLLHRAGIVENPEARFGPG
jgi:rod shape-determining protein MreD